MNLPEVINNSANYFGDINAGLLKGSELTGLIAKDQAVSLGHALERGEMSINFEADKITIIVPVGDGAKVR
jgi:hypothetical protein